AVGRRRHLGAEIADEIGGRRRIVRIDPDQHAVEWRSRVHGRIGGLAVTVETRRSVRWDHEGEYPTALRGVGSRRGGHGRDAKSSAETGCCQSCFLDLFFPLFVVGISFCCWHGSVEPSSESLSGEAWGGVPWNRHTSTGANAPRANLCYCKISLRFSSNSAL